MKVLGRVVSIAIGFALVLWLLGTTIDTFFFSQGPFMENLYWGLSVHDLLAMQRVVEFVVDNSVHNVRPAFGHFQREFRRDVIFNQFLRIPWELFSGYDARIFLLTGFDIGIA